MIPIYIPSAGRADCLMTTDHLSDEAASWTTLLVPPAETAAYTAALKGRPFRIYPCAQQREGVHAVRQFILEWAKEDGHDHIIMADDDFKFFQRRSDWALGERAKLSSVLPPEDVDLMLAEVERHLVQEGIRQVGVSPRGGNNRIEERFWKDVTRVTGFYGVHVPTLFNLGFSFLDMKFREDFYLTLTLLTNGIPNRLLVDWAYDQRESNYRGGCSTYRTMENNNESARHLYSRFPDCVRLEAKTTDWKGLGTGRLDCRIQWRKAFNGPPDAIRSR